MWHNTSPFPSLRDGPLPSPHFVRRGKNYRPLNLGLRFSRKAR